MAEPDASVSAERGNTAADAMKEAQQRGASGRADRGDLSQAQKALRDTAIVASLHAGMEVREVAKEFKITPRSVRRVFEAFELRPTALEKRPMEIVERLLRTYEQQMRNFAAVALDTLNRAPAVAIAALKGHADSLERYQMLLVDVGKVPENLETFRSEAEMERVGEMMFEKMREVAAGTCTPAEAQEFFHSVLISHSALSTYDAPASSVRELSAGDG